MPKIVTTDIFAKKSNVLHNNIYDYSLVEYVNAKTKVKIVCPVHGVFEQKPTHHLQGSGCQKCYESNSKNKKLPWSYSDWQSIAESSNNFDSYKLYIIRCWDKDEEFYKIGRTFTKIKRRFTKGKSKKIPYNYEITSVEIFENAKNCCEKEKQLQKLNINNKYIPIKNFGGMQECFSKVNNMGRESQI